MTTLTVAGDEVQLHPARALIWPRRKTVIIADPHWGKSATFRAHGIAVPELTLGADLDRLSLLIMSTQAERLVILGDLLHARAGRSDVVHDTVQAWRGQHRSLDIQVIRGNHDRSAGDPPTSWGFTMHPEPFLDPPFAYRHHPDPTEGHYSLAGHVHPAVSIPGRGRQRLRLPCFVFGPDLAILPAFGAFTGTATLAARPDLCIFAIADQEVLEVSPPAV